MKWRAAGFLAVVIGFAVGLGGYAYWGDGHYRIAHRGESHPIPALVANQPIPKGTPGSLVLSQSMYAPTTVSPIQVEAGVISDPAFLRGRASAVDIFPGQQLTETNFTESDASASP